MCKLGARYIEKEGKAFKVTAVSVYLEDKGIQSLAVKWKGKTPAELMDSDEFYNDIVTGKRLKHNIFNTSI